MHARANALELPRAHVCRSEVRTPGHVDADRKYARMHDALAAANGAVVEHLAADFGLGQGVQERVQVAARLKADDVVSAPVRQQLLVDG